MNMVHTYLEIGIYQNTLRVSNLLGGYLLVKGMHIKFLSRTGKSKAN